MYKIFQKDRVPILIFRSIAANPLNNGEMNLEGRIGNASSSMYPVAIEAKFYH